MSSTEIPQNPPAKKPRGRPKKPKLTKKERLERIEEYLADHRVAEKMLKDEYERFITIKEQYPTITDVIDEALSDLSDEIESIEAEKAEVMKLED